MNKEILSGDSLYRDVITYSQMGEHRTATEADLRTSEWIAEQLEEAGLATCFQTFSLRQFFVHETSLVVAGERINCFPLWFPRGTGPQPVRAQLAAFGAGSDGQKGRIALVKLPFRDRGITLVKSFKDGATSPDEADVVEETIRTPIYKAAEAGALAVVAITDGPAKEITAYNSPDWLEPWPVPVVMVGSRYEPALTAAAELGAEASLLVDGSEEPEARARNVIGRYNSGKDAIVLSTPHSGWFNCGGERAPGVALSLAIARWVGKRQPQTRYVFDFNSGHELMNLGMRHFLQKQAPPAEQVLCWIHLGASIATWGWEESATGLRRRAEPEKYRVGCRNPDLLPLLNRAFADLPGVKPFTSPGLGEMAQNLPMEYRGFSVHGGLHRFLHTPADGSDSTAPELLEPVALALSRALESIEALAKQ